MNSEWTKESLSKSYSIDKEILRISAPSVFFDFSECTRIDSAGAIEIIRLKNAILAKGCRIESINLSSEDQKLLQFYEKNFSNKPPLPTLNPHIIESFGRGIVDTVEGIGDFLSFVGEGVAATLKVMIKPWSFRFSSFIKHVDIAAIRAIPIIMILSFLIGLVVAYQSAGYLNKVGGDIFVVDLSVMSVFRELSPMIAAILIAARSASAFTAEIGTMKITEEIDAMRTMGLDPFVFLVLPRVFALILMMPLIIFAADIAGMMGALVVANLHLGISVNEFIDRMYLEISINELYVGLGKSPIYGGIIAVVGCYRGFQVSGSTESIGALTTKSVVSAIFWVIICDACIAMALTKLGI
ncbi:MlaE family lipid ABC transporter permease subunit [Sulfuricurvum sp.]|uniref:ABC transporter permease n=1 Tax=Sulfuricurvum sp. TaxID=2025608 RepID=UPI003BB7D9BE